MNTYRSSLFEAVAAFKEIAWHASNIHLHFARSADGLHVANNLTKPVSKLKNTPVSGDHLREIKHRLELDTDGYTCAREKCDTL